MSIDETAQIHERITHLVGKRYVDWVPDFAVHHVLIVAITLVAGLILINIVSRDLKALWQWSPQACIGLLIGCVTLVTGAAVLETVGYKFFYGGAAPSLYKAEVVAEEFLEMFGASLILRAVMLFGLSKSAKSANLT